MFNPLLVIESKLLVIYFFNSIFRLFFTVISKKPYLLFFLKRFNENRYPSHSDNYSEKKQGTLEYLIVIVYLKLFNTGFRLNSNFNTSFSYDSTLI